MATPPTGLQGAEGRYFRSKVDPLFGVMLAVTGSGFLAVAVVTALAGLTKSAGVPPTAAALLPLAVVSFLVWVFARTGYRIADGHLLVQCGPFRVSIPLAEIDEIAPSSRWNHGFALSTEQLNIRYRSSRSGVDISPADRSGFLDALCAAEPSLRRFGERVVRS